MSDAAAISDMPGPAETEIAREPVALLSRDMLLTVDAELAIVRVFGSDRSGNAVRIGAAPERALRIGLAFIRAALRIKPSLRPALRDALFTAAEAAAVAAAEGGAS